MVGIGANGKWTSTGRKNGMTLFYHSLLPSIRQCSQLSRWSHCSQLCSPAAVAQPGQLRIACRVRQGLKKSNIPCDRLKGLFLTSCCLACVTHGISSSQDSSDSSVASSAKISHRAMKTSRGVFDCSYHFVSSTGSSGAMESWGNVRSPLRSLHCHSRPATPNQHQPLCNQWLGSEIGYCMVIIATCLQLLTCNKYL